MARCMDYLRNEYINECVRVYRHETKPMETQRTVKTIAIVHGVQHNIVHGVQHNIVHWVQHNIVHKVQHNIVHWVQHNIVHWVQPNIVHACWQVTNLQQVVLLQVFLLMYLFTFSKESENVEEKLGEFVYINPTFVQFILRTRLGIWLSIKGLFYDYQLWLSFMYLLVFLSQAKKTCWVCTWAYI